MPDLPANVNEATDPNSGWTVYTARQGATEIRLVPAAGCNVISIEHHGRQLLKVPESFDKPLSFWCGTPVLYPTPGRTQDGRFTFGGQEFHFRPVGDCGAIHGVVNNAPWEFVGAETDGERSELSCRLDFRPGSEWFDQFPLIHRLELTVSLRPGAVRWTYTVNNSTGTDAIPFGFGLHPWFLYHGARDQAYLTIPADQTMELVDLKPTGELIDVQGTPMDSRSGVCLQGFEVDAAYFGIGPDESVTIDYRDVDVRLALRASAEFNHVVAYTPADSQTCCIENWTCAPNAHNLHARDIQRSANLQVVPPGKSHSGWIELQVEAG